MASTTPVPMFTSGTVLVLRAVDLIVVAKRSKGSRTVQDEIGQQVARNTNDDSGSL